MKSKRDKDRIQASQRTTQQRTNEDIMSYVKKNATAKAAEETQAKLPSGPPTQSEIWQNAQNENIDKIWPTGSRRPPPKTPPTGGRKS